MHVSTKEILQEKIHNLAWKKDVLCGKWNWEKQIFKTCNAREVFA